MRPVQVVLLYFREEEGPNFHYLLAAATLISLPGIILYFLAQKRFTEGLLAEIKG